MHISLSFSKCKRNQGVFFFVFYYWLNWCEFIFGAMEFTAAAAFGFAFFVYLLILHESCSYVLRFATSVGCARRASDFMFGFLLRKANLHMDYLLHKYIARIIFVIYLFFSMVGFQYWIRVSAPANTRYSLHVTEYSIHAKDGELWMLPYVCLVHKFNVNRFRFCGFFNSPNWDFNFNSGPFKDTYGLVSEILLRPHPTYRLKQQLTTQMYTHIECSQLMDLYSLNYVSEQSFTVLSISMTFSIKC